jgi:heme oxygenase (biliverdin-IX-beta and delta-forming)
MSNARSENPGAGLRWRLRQATDALHRSVERRFDLERGIEDAGDYCALLARFFGFYAPIERELLRLDWRNSGIDISTRHKSPWLAADLSDFGLAPAAIAALPQYPAAPRSDSLPEALGILYVLEGATLGGQVVLRRLSAKIGISPVFGGRFFASYGPDVGRMWRGYVDVLERCGDAPPRAETIERSAVVAFKAFDAWLSPGGGTRGGGGLPA